jgi:exopolysaccharide biosynthesis polyprenyl glycosylphosphotransferase
MARAHAGSATRTLVIGAGTVGRQIAERLSRRGELGLRPIGFLDADPLPAPDGAVTHPVLGGIEDLEDVVCRYDVGHVVLSFSSAGHEELLDLSRRCRVLGVDLTVVPRLFEDITRRVSVEHIGGIAVMWVEHANPRSLGFAVKHAVDRVAALAMLLAAAPLLAVLAVAVRLDSPGPILYRQARVGRDGREFEMLKFRTMTGDSGESGEADAAWAASESSSGTPEARGGDRRTALGRVLRRWGLDELPQLINVARGEMSLVGPRPERVQYVRDFERKIHRYGDRHRVKSGITGWAQVHGLRGQTSLADRIEWDNYYIDNWSLWLDVKILARTLWAAGGRDG